MSEGLKEDQSFWEKIKKNYRLVVYNYETFQELATYRLSLLNIYIIISSIVVIITLLLLSLIVFTPVKQLIPGYGDIERNTQFVQMEQDIQYLEEALAAQEQYNLKLQKILNSDGSGIVSPVNSEEKKSEPIANASPSTNEILQNHQAVQEKFLAEMIPPLRGQVSAAHNIEDKHFGTDIIAPSNSPIKASLEGKVIFSGWTVETGYTIGIQHPSNILTFYKHNSSLLREVGDFVLAGEVIAIIGNTGELSSGPHLHFELWIDGQVVDAEKYLQFN